MVRMTSMMNKEAQKITPAQIAAGGGVSQSQEQLQIEEDELIFMKNLRKELAEERAAKAGKEKAMTPLLKSMLPSQEAQDLLKHLPKDNESQAEMYARIEEREIEASKKFQAEMAARDKAKAKKE